MRVQWCALQSRVVAAQWPRREGADEEVVSKTPLAVSQLVTVVTGDHL